MNITLKSDHIKTNAVDELGSWIQFEDFIGFSTGNEVEGFNNFGDNFTDAFGNPYPKISEAALLYYTYFNKYNSEDVVPAAMSGAVVRVLGTEDAEKYSDVSYKHRLSVTYGDGWYTIHAFLLPTDTPGEVHYDTLQGKVLDESGDQIFLDALKDVSGIQHIEIQKCFMPKNEITLNKMAAELSDLAIAEGICSENYWKRWRQAMFLESQVIGAKIKFYSGYQYKAQEMIEEMQKINPYANC